MTDTQPEPRRSPTRRGLACLDALNFFLADVRDGLGPYLAIYLASRQHWDPSKVGVAMAAMLVGTIETNFAVPGELSAYLVLIEAPSAGTAFLAAEGSGPEVACSVWLYLYDEDRDQVEDRWTPFLEHRWGGDAGQPAQ